MTNDWWSILIFKNIIQNVNRISVYLPNVLLYNGHGNTECIIL